MRSARQASRVALPFRFIARFAPNCLQLVTAPFLYEKLDLTQSSRHAFCVIEVHPKCSRSASDVPNHGPKQTGNVTFKLEGRLSSEWVQVLEDCWQNAVTGHSKDRLYVDLTEVTSVDAVGRNCLKSLYRQGARFIANDCLTKAIVAEIHQG